MIVKGTYTSVWDHKIGIPVINVTGTSEERVVQVIKAIQKLEKEKKSHNSNKKQSMSRRNLAPFQSQSLRDHHGRGTHGDEREVRHLPHTLREVRHLSKPP